MDTPRRIRTPLLALGVVAVITQALITSASPPRIEVLHGTPAQRAMVTWALERFERAGLPLPPMQIVFHEDIRDCQGHVGLYWAELRRLDMCVYHVDSLAKRTILHELAHAWDGFVLREPTRRDFLHLRQLQTWASQGVAWELRGQEQTAEVIAWGLMDQPLYLTIPNNRPDELHAAFELLTGGPSPFRSADDSHVENVFSPEELRSR
jgi:hypothetical protein